MLFVRASRRQFRRADDVNVVLNTAIRLNGITPGDVETIRITWMCVLTATWSAAMAAISTISRLSRERAGLPAKEVIGVNGHETTASNRLVSRYSRNTDMDC